MKKSYIHSPVFLMIGIVLLLIQLCSMIGQAADWKPTKPIEFVAPFAPGGGSDVLARSIASIIEGEKLCPVPLLVANKAGGSGLVGTTAVVQTEGGSSCPRDLHPRSGASGLGGRERSSHLS